MANAKATRAVKCKPGSYTFAPAAIAFSCLAMAAQDRALDQEAALGRQMAQELRHSTTLLPAPVQNAVEDYVVQLGARLAAQFPSPAFAYKFSVVPMDRTDALHEPLALPGGYIFVPLSLLFAASDEAQFAGMLAQAMARQPLRINSDKPGMLPLFFVGGWGDAPLIPAAALNPWRDMQLQADAAAAVAMSHARFDPAALLRYIERLQPPDRKYSAFPPRASRIAALEQTILDLPKAAYTQNDEYYRIQDLARAATPKPRSPTLHPSN
jgi:predicted Zn-dependent protease